MEPAPVQRLSSTVVYRNPWLTIREDAIRLADGTDSIYGIVVKPDFTLVLPRGDAGFWLVSQYRYPVGRRLWEFPQGSWPAGADGSPEDLARAELAEETGLRAASLEHLGRIVHAQGISPTEFDVYLATGLTEGSPDREDTEQDMEHRFVPDAEVDELIRRGELCDAPSLAALTLYRLAGHR